MVGSRKHGLPGLDVEGGGAREGRRRRRGAEARVRIQPHAHVPARDEGGVRGVQHGARVGEEEGERGEQRGVRAEGVVGVEDGRRFGVDLAAGLEERGRQVEGWEQVRAQVVARCKALHRGDAVVC